MNLYDGTDCLPHVKPAFPNPALADENFKPRPGDDGLTKREYAAIHIAAAIATRRMVNERPIQEAVAQEAVALADAVLREAGE